MNKAAKERIWALRPCPLGETLTVRNMLDHLRIVHRRRLSRDVSMVELRQVWEHFHKPLDQEKQ